MHDYREFAELPVFAHGARDAEGRPINVRDGGPPKWFNDAPPPAVGDRVRANFNKLGYAKVVGYFAEEGYMGLLVAFEEPPAWYVEQNKGNVPGHLFGPEFDLKGV